MKDNRISPLPLEGNGRAGPDSPLPLPVEDRTRTIWRLGVGLAALLVLLAVVFRVAALERLPGLNGDEAYYGVAMLNVRDGHPQSLRTASGLPFNPGYLIPVYLLHVGHPIPSFTLLRLPALLSGLAAVLLAFPLLARVVDRWTALFATLLLACLPIAIAYSRFGWDQSQAPLLGLLCLYFALKRQVLGATASFLMGLWIHPLNVFLAPVLLGPTALAWWRARHDADAAERRARWYRLWPWLLGGTLLAGLVLYLLVPPFFVRLGTERMLDAGSNLVNLGGWAVYAVMVGDFLAGTTIYTYLSAPPPHGALLERLLVGILLVGLLLAAIPRFRQSQDTTALGLLGGTLLSLAAGYVFLGLSTVQPGWERYSMWLVMPACLVSALAVSSLGDSPTARSRQLAGVLAVCALLLGTFYLRYFQVLIRTGGEVHRAARTGSVEPKQAAYEAVVAWAGDDAPVTILAEDWWSYWPIRYLAHDRPSTQVVLCRGDRAKAADLTSPRRRFVVGFVDGPSDRWLAQHAPRTPQQTFNDAAGRPLLRVWDLGYGTELLAGVVEAAVAAPGD
ncbi:MAG: hypothetical protein JNM56_30905 [Planctomycetia bacterium]|nr:hypothetical protein [Planctomycetia bacterium]